MKFVFARPPTWWVHIIIVELDGQKKRGFIGEWKIRASKRADSITWTHKFRWIQGRLCFAILPSIWLWHYEQILIILDLDWNMAIPIVRSYDKKAQFLYQKSVEYAWQISVLFLPYGTKNIIVFDKFNSLFRIMVKLSLLMVDCRQRVNHSVCLGGGCWWWSNWNAKNKEKLYFFPCILKWISIYHSSEIKFH